MTTPVFTASFPSVLPIAWAAVLRVAALGLHGTGSLIHFFDEAMGFGGGLQFLLGLQPNPLRCVGWFPLLQPKLVGSGRDFRMNGYR